MPPEARVFLGVDAGGSKTLALAAYPGGAIAGRGEAGPGNYQSVGAEAAYAALEAAVNAALRSAGVEKSAVAAACLGMAGVDRPDDRRTAEAWAARLLGEVPVTIANDAQIVLAAGTPDGWGAAVISGTGSMVYAADRRGNTARAGGWGYLLGDEGSGYAVGLAGLRAVARAHDGRGAPTLLTDKILSALRLPDPSALVQRVYQAGMTRAEIASLSAVVDEAAAQNDPAALEIIAQAADELALAVRAVAGRLGLPEPVPCALAGGMLVKGTALREAFALAAARGGPRLEPLALVEEPAHGALRMAEKSVG